MDAAAEIGRNPVSKHQIEPEYGVEISRLTRDGTAKPVSRDQILRREQDWQPNTVDPTCSMRDHTYIQKCAYYII